MFKIETYKLKDKTIVFDYPELFIYKEPLIKGTDTLINYLSDNAECTIIKFSNRKIKHFNAILHYHHSEEDGEYYIEQLTNQLVYLCPCLLKFFPKRPYYLFVNVSPRIN